MGNTTSNTINEATNVVNSIISTVVNTTNQNAVSTITGRQVNSLQIKGKVNFDCGSGGVNICLSNTSDISSQLVTNFKNQAVTQIKTALLTEITNQNSQLTKIVKGFLSVLNGGSKDENTTNIKNMISNYINNDINITTIQSAVQQVSSVQQNSLILGGKGSDITFEGSQCNITLSNDFQAKIVMNAVASSIVDNFISNTVTNKVVNRASQTMDVKSEGIDTALYAAAALAIACGLFYVLQGIGTRIAAKGGGGGESQSSGSFNKILTILFIIVIIGIIGLWLYNQYSKKNWPFTPEKYYGCKIGTFTDPATGQQSIINTDGCFSYAKNDNRGIYKSQQECELKQTDPSNGTCGQFWGCQYDADKKIINNCVQYPSAYYTINWPDSTKTQVNSWYKNQQDCKSDSCPSKWTCAIDNNGFAIKGQCKLITDPFQIANINQIYSPDSNYNLCGGNTYPNSSNANILTTPLFDTEQACEQSNACNTTWSCINPGDKNGNACSQSACPLTCTTSDDNCPLQLYSTKSDCEQSCSESSLQMIGLASRSKCVT